MPSPFVWFDNIGNNPSQTTSFLKNTFGWAINDIGPMSFLTADGQDKPFAATADALKGVSGWVPYVEVDNLVAAVENAIEHGAKLLAENLQGPAGVASFILDPGGAPIALWKRAEGI